MRIGIIKVILFILVISTVRCSSEKEDLGGSAESPVPYGAGGPTGEKSTKAKSTESKISYDFTLPDINGATWTLSSLKGKVVIIYFWATWCATCRVGIPHLVGLYNKYKDDGLIVCGIGMDKKSRLESFARQYKINYPILIGTQEITHKWGIHVIPTTYILDRELKIVFKYRGFSPGMERQLEENIRSLFKAKLL